MNFPVKGEGVKGNGEKPANCIQFLAASSFTPSLIHPFTLHAL